MGWRFRKSFNPIPGVRLTLSSSGISTSVGVGPLRVSTSLASPALTATLPGTGLSFRTPLHGERLQAPPPAVPAYIPPAPTNQNWPLHTPLLSLHQEMQDIKSAGSSLLTSPGLSVFRERLAAAQQQFRDVEIDLGEVSSRAEEDTRRWRSWADGWLFRRLMKEKFASLEAKSDESRAMRSELEEQLRLSRLDTDFAVPDAVARCYSRLSDEFAGCSRSQRIWDNVAHRATNRAAERTVAGRVVDLKPVRFSAGQCGVIQAALPAPCLQNANGGDIYIYPAFIVYHVSSTNYALIEFGDVELKVEPMKFHEEQTVPGDAKQVGTTWAKANKDGSPDLRFKDNYPIPVMEYARLTLNSATGLNEEYLLSNVEAAKRFEHSWLELRQAVLAGV